MARLTRIPIIVGIGGHPAGWIFFDGQRVRTFLRNCEETLDGYDSVWKYHGEERPLPELFDPMNNGEKFGREFIQYAPDALDYIEGCNDTDEAGYCVFMYPGFTEVPNDYTVPEFREMLLASHGVIEPESKFAHATAPGEVTRELYLEDEVNQFAPNDVLLSQDKIRWVDEPAVAGWSYPMRDQ
jgi:hypothetical protein